MNVRMERPSSGQLAVSAFVGLLFGALGGGFAAVLQLFLLAVIAVGVWQAVTWLAVIAERMGDDPIDHPDTVQTVPVRRHR